MKKRVIPLILAVLVLASISTAALAEEVRASNYLTGYGIELCADGDGTLSFSFVVDARGYMTKVGAQSVRIDQKVNGQWVTYTTLFAATNPDYWAYDALGKGGSDFVYDVPTGKTYRAVLTAYAGDSTGYDTGTAVSNSVVCK